MTAATRRKAPPEMGPRGRRFWRQTLTIFDLSDAETELLAECCRLLDEVEELREVVAADGVTVAGSRGQKRAHPALAELRQHRLALGRLLAQLRLPDEDGGALASPVQARGRNANAARWGAELKGVSRGAS